jgi:hypothetical protein
VVRGEQRLASHRPDGDADPGHRAQIPIAFERSPPSVTTLLIITDSVVG